MTEPWTDRPATRRPTGITGDLAQGRHVAVFLLAVLGVVLGVPGAAHAACMPDTVVVVLSSPTNGKAYPLVSGWPRLQGKVVSPLCGPAKDVLYHLKRRQESFGSRALPLPSGQSFSASFDKPIRRGTYTLDIRARLMINGKLQDGLTTTVSFQVYAPGDAGPIPSPTERQLTVGHVTERGHVVRVVPAMSRHDPVGRAAWLPLWLASPGGRG